MNNRIMVPMESLIRSISMGPFGSDVKVEYMRDNGMPIIDGSNLTGIKMNWNNYRYLDKNRAEKLQGAIAHKGDIIVTHRGTLGQLSYVPEDCPFEEFLISQSQFRVTLDTKKVNPVFFAYYFHTSEGQKRLLSFANYVGVPALASATTNFRALEFPLIDLQEQNKIANVLETIDKALENNSDSCTNLENMAKLLYDYWFVQFDFPDENGKPYKSSGGKMVWNEELKREIPDGWEVRYLKGLYNIERGLSYTSKDIASGVGIPMINLACIDRNREYRDGELKYHNGKVPDEAYLKAGDLLIACTDLTREREIIGCPILVPDDGIKYTYSMDIAKITFPNASINDLYMYMALRTDFYHDYIKAWASGTNVLHLNLEGLDWYKTYIPPIKLQNKFADMIGKIHSKKSEIISENQQLASLRDFLLPMLMNGQVKVG